MLPFLSFRRLLFCLGFIFLGAIFSNAQTTNTTNQTSCGSYTWLVNNQTYATSGTYSYIVGVDTEILNLTITPLPICQNGGIVDLQVCGCNCASGYYGYHCEFAVCYTTYGSSGVSACDSYTWNNNTYTQSGSYAETFVNAGGCDSIHTLNLTIMPSTTNTTTISGCTPYTWLVNNQTYNSTGIYSNTVGCHTEILDLTLSAPPPCQNGATINSFCGCDCPSGYYGVYCQFAVCYPNSGASNVSACASYTWNNITYTSSGIYTGTFTNIGGCDSVHTLTLTINPLPIVTAPNVYACPNTSVTLGGTPTGGTWNLPNPYLGNAMSYTYYYTDVNGCTGNATASINNTSAIITNVFVNNITGITAKVNYSAVGGIGWYEVRYKEISSSIWTTGTNGISLMKTMLNLTPNTAYEVQVRGFCSTSSVGAWSASTFFNTDNSCTTPVGLSIINVNATNATGTWTPMAGAGYYNVRFRVSPSGAWNLLTTVGTTLLLPGLTVNTLYDVQIATVCNGAVSAYSSTVQFTTVVSCFPPTGLFANNITGTTAKLNWTAAIGASFYDVRYKKTSVATWTNTSSTGITKNLAGLTLNTNYEFQVRTNCGTGTSAYSASAFFTTAASKPSNNSEFIIPNSKLMGVYPNPIHNELHMDISVNENTLTEIKLLDMSGRVLKQLQTTTEVGVNLLTMDVSELVNGVYTMQVFSNHILQQTNKIVKE
jgi:Secretion system C-terminal sorting domain/Fibronectin type III domain